MMKDAVILAKGIGCHRPYWIGRKIVAFDTDDVPKCHLFIWRQEFRGVGIELSSSQCDIACRIVFMPTNQGDPFRIVRSSPPNGDRLLVDE